jgi:hypothetical protein
MSTIPRAQDGDEDEQPEPERLNDLQVYARLVRTSEELRSLSRRCWSTCSRTGLEASAVVIRTLASALYRRNLDE